MMAYGYCEYGEHEIEGRHGGYVVYTDLKHGIEKDIVMCRSCYAKHILKYYPDSHIADYIRSNPGEYRQVGGDE